ncbi:hypothetical protein [Lignipirellula cremea]|uniref:Uncharacterized protein n=1 Tax=Lignipirellula cremea TaxID=2528010 RepID=A0A518DVD1_9BACT|nr:hypothetical protein [Lignipirellula cremea]QDU95790.1 hypothetical protein Pla8534_36070 [Lignipirellula cremea]
MKEQSTEALIVQNPKLFFPGSYAVKQLVQKIKSAAREFAANDPEFLGMIEKAMEGEARTVARRFAGKQN